mgnify:CR=1 FL=1
MNGGVIALLLAAMLAMGGGIYLVVAGNGPGPILVAVGVMLLVLAGALRGKAKNKKENG